MRLFPKTGDNYEKEIIKEILKRDGIFSYQASAGELKVNFSIQECMRHWEIRVPVAEFLNYLMDKINKESLGGLDLASVTETGKNIIQTMQVCAVKDGNVKSKLLSVVSDDAEGLILKNEDDKRDYNANEIVLVETSLEKIKWVLENFKNLQGLSQVIILFGSRADFREISDLTRQRGIHAFLVVPLEKLALGYLKKLI